MLNENSLIIFSLLIIQRVYLELVIFMTNFYHTIIGWQNVRSVCSFEAINLYINIHNNNLDINLDLETYSPCGVTHCDKHSLWV